VISWEDALLNSAQRLLNVVQDDWHRMTQASRHYGAKFPFFIRVSYSKLQATDIVKLLQENGDITYHQ
jgi:hypothetical protein